MTDGDKNAGPEQHQVPDVDDAMGRATPSQAEGDRDTIDADLEQKLGYAEPSGGQPRYATGTGGQGDEVNTPSQAEGNRGEIDEDLTEKGES